MDQFLHIKNGNTYHRVSQKRILSNTLYLPTLQQSLIAYTSLSSILIPQNCDKPNPDPPKLKSPPSETVTAKSRAFIKAFRRLRTKNVSNLKRRSCRSESTFHASRRHQRSISPDSPHFHNNSTLAGRIIKLVVIVRHGLWSARRINVRSHSVAP